MIDSNVDPDRAANERAEEFAARRARRRAILATGKPSSRRNIGNLATMASAPPSADVGTLTETVAVTAPAKDSAPTGDASPVFGSTTQLLAAAALVAVLLVAWFVERRSGRKVEEVDHG